MKFPTLTQGRFKGTGKIYPFDGFELKPARGQTKVIFDNKAEVELAGTLKPTQLRLALCGLLFGLIEDKQFSMSNFEAYAVLRSAICRYFFSEEAVNFGRLRDQFFPNVRRDDFQKGIDGFIAGQQYAATMENFEITRLIDALESALVSHPEETLRKQGIIA